MILLIRLRPFLLKIFMIQLSYTMRDYRTRKRPNNFFRSRFFLWILFIILIFFARSAYSSFMKKKRAHTEEARYQERFEELQRKKQSLQEDIERLETERGLEEEYRARFNVVKEGETLIKIVE